jgi:2-polyprenyl-3-methyl-5-hydroxy-6-metoxy-1,4-benzoquinol methylase
MANPDAANRIRARLLGIVEGSVLTSLIDIGYQTGLFEVSLTGPLTCEELSRKAGLTQRYVQEWLGAMATSGIYSYDATTGQYTLPEEHAAWLTGNSAQNYGPTARFLSQINKQVTSLIRCFREGGGIPYSEYQPEITECIDDTWRRVYDQLLDPLFIGSVEGLSDRLRSGIRVLDIGCGSGHAMNVLASKYPQSMFYGYDIDDRAIDLARVEGKNMGVTNSTFDLIDVSELPMEPKFDLITAFDSIHDQANPEAVLHAIQKALEADGIFIMVEYRLSSRVEENIGNPLAALFYGISVMHCVPVSIAAGGPGLGLAWGEQAARQMLIDAGFSRVEFVSMPTRPHNHIFVCRR